MAHSVRVGFLGVDSFAERMIASVADRQVIPEANIYIADPQKTYRHTFADNGFTFFDDNISALMKSEIVVISESRQEFATLLAPICAATRGKILLSVTEGIDCQYIQERVTRGTYVACAHPVHMAGDKYETTLTFSSGFPEYLKSVCADLMGCRCIIKAA